MPIRIRNMEFDAPGPELPELLAARLAGLPTRLPPIAAGEDPADIFVDLCETDPTWREPVAVAVAGLLAAWVRDFAPPGYSPRVEALGELCYLAARIGSAASLDSLRLLASNPRTTALLGPGEDLRLRALRAAVGLLGANPGLRTEADRGMLLAAREEPRLQWIALAGLIGLWPEEFASLADFYPSWSQEGKLLGAALRLAFPRAGTLG